jgi:hypothetical protein
VSHHAPLYGISEIVLSSTEKVKTFYPRFRSVAERTVQHEEIPQPPPPTPPEGIDGEETPAPEPEEQQKEDITFLTSPEPHFGHSASSFAFIPRRRENLSPHLLQTYS